MTDPQAPTTEAGRRLAADIRELAGVVHQTDSLRSHADPNDHTGWNRGPIETCEDPYCIDGRDASAAILAIEAEARAPLLEALRLWRDAALDGDALVLGDLVDITNDILEERP